MEEKEKRAKKLKELIKNNIKELEKLSEEGISILSEIEKELSEIKDSNYIEESVVEINADRLIDIKNKLIYERERRKNISIEIEKQKQELDEILKDIKKQYPYISEDDIIGEKIEDIETLIGESKKTENYFGNIKELLTMTKELITEVKPIADEIKQKRGEEIKRAKGEKYREELLSDKEEKMVFVKISEKKSFMKPVEQIYSGVVPKKLLNLSERYYGVFLPSEEHYYREYGPHDEFTDSRDLWVEEISYEDCSLEQKNMINEKRKKLEELSAKIAKDKTGKYDKVGIARLPIYGTRGAYIRKSEQIGEIPIEVTQRELVEAGILPEDLEWSRRKITSKDMAQATKAKGVTKSEEKGIWGKLVDKVKNLFKEKGE